MTERLDPQDARQGEKSGRMLKVLVAAILLAVVVWGATEFFAETQDPEAPPASVDTVEPVE